MNPCFNNNFFKWVLAAYVAKAAFASHEFKIFSIKNCFFSSECVYHLVKNINVENFEVLCLKNVELNEYKTKISIKKFKNLRVLFLNDGSFELIENFCDLAELKYLEALSIRNNKISSLKSFFENLDSKLFLTYLDISFIDFSNECVAALKEFLRWTNSLKVLIIGKSFTEEQITEILASRPEACKVFICTDESGIIYPLKK